MTTTASIYFNKIRLDYPQAGKNNDSQGFRDNFRNIYNAFSATDVILSDLEVNAVRLGSESSDFGYNIIKKATLQSCPTKVVNNTVAPTSGTVTVNYLDGNYQKYSLDAGLTTFVVENWPEAGFKADMDLSVTPFSTATTTIAFGGADYQTVGGVSLPVVANSTATLHFSAWTDDGGNTVYLLQKGV